MLGIRKKKVDYQKGTLGPIMTKNINMNFKKKIFNQLLSVFKNL